MPELPDITIYLEALERRVLGQPLNRLRVASPFVLRTAVPPVESVHGRTVIDEETDMEEPGRNKTCSRRNQPILSALLET